MRISYRNKVRLKKLLRFLGILLALSVVLSVVLLIYLEPYMVYDRDGGHLVLSRQDEPGESQQPTEPRPVVSDPKIVYSEDPVEEKNILDMGGYYITTSMLSNPQAVLSALKELPSGCAVMIELKSRFGNFYYSTDVYGAPLADNDRSAVDEIIDWINSKGFYSIAVISAYSDYTFAIENQSSGLPLASGALWWDDYNCYWLDPADELVSNYLMETVRELAELGFHEVAFSNFDFPDASSIVYDSDLSRTEVLEQAAGDLTAMAQGSGVTISFVTEETDFPHRLASGRIYVPNVDGSRVERYVQSYRELGNMKELVFMANSRDTRFEGYAQLRPLLAE